jgi:hypothetical protein
MATINVHHAKDGTKTFRVRVRRKGQPIQTASFSSLRDARLSKDPGSGSFHTWGNNRLTVVPLLSCLMVWGTSDEVITAIQAVLPEAWLSSR